MTEIDPSRLWYYTERDVVPEDTEVSVKRLMVFRLPRTIYRKGARYFSDVLDDEKSRHIYHLFLLFDELVQRMYHMLGNTAGAQLQLFFEVVEAEMGFSEGSGMSARHIYHHPSQFGCVGELLQDRIHNERVDIFLPQIPEVAVAEYRIWVCFEGLHVMGAMKSIMQEVDMRQNSNRPSVPSFVHNRQMEPPQRWQPWLTLKGVEELTYWLDNYGGTTLFSSTEARARAKLDFTSNGNNNNGNNNGNNNNGNNNGNNNNGNNSNGTTTNEAETQAALTERAAEEDRHPLNPMNHFHLVHVFRDQIQSNPIAESQRLLSQYVDADDLERSGIKLKFPKPRNVLCLPPTAFKPESMYNKYLPDFQKGMIVVDDLPLGDGRGSSHKKKNKQSKPVVVYRQEPEPGMPDWDRILVGTLGVAEEWAVDRYGADGTPTQPIFNPQVLSSIVHSSSHAKVDSVQTMSSLEPIRLLSQADLPIIFEQWKRSPTEFRQSWRAHQDWVLAELEATVLQQTSNLSDAARCIVDEIIDTDLLDTPRTLNISDVKLDIFGNMVAARLEAYDKLLFVYATHRQFMLLQMGSYDAFRHEYNLHYNAMLIGQSNTSKSYALDLLEDCAVQGSVQALSYQTLKADASDGDNNDMITVMNEFSLKAVSETEKSRGDVTTMEALIKEKATSMKMRVKLLQITENGERITKITFSSCIGCWFGASNDDPSQVSESFASRFHWDMFQAVERPSISIVDLEDADKRLPALEKQKIQRFKDWMRQMQCLHWLVEKLIMTGGLMDVSLFATNFIVTAVNNYLMARNVHVHNRIFKRIKIQARIFTIHLALHYLYFVPLKLLSPDGKWVDNFYGQPFELEQLKSIDLYLRDEESIAYFVLGLMREQIVNPIEDIVRKCLRDLHDQRKTEFLRYLCVGTRYESATAATTATTTTDQGSPPKVASPLEPFLTCVQPEKGKGEEEVVQDKGDDDDQLDKHIKSTPVKKSQEIDDGLDRGEQELRKTYKNMSKKPACGSGNHYQRGGLEDDEQEGKTVRIYSYSYLRIGKHKDQVPKHIQSHYMSISKPSFFQIKAAWEKICNGQNMLHTYKANPLGPDHFPVRDESVPKTMQPLTIVENGEAFVHADVLCNSSLGQDVLMEAIESTFHQNTRPRKIVFGEQHDYAHPNLFRSLELKEGSAIFTTPNVLYMNDLSSRVLSGLDSVQQQQQEEEEAGSTTAAAPNMRKIPVFYLNEDLDTYSCGGRLSLLGINPTPLRIQAIHPRYLMGLMLRDPRCKGVDRTCRYPESFLRADKEARESRQQQQDLHCVEPAALSSKSRTLAFPDPNLELEDESLRRDMDEIGFILDEEENSMELVEEEEESASRLPALVPTKEVHKTLIISESSPVRIQPRKEKRAVPTQYNKKSKKQRTSAVYPQAGKENEHTMRLFTQQQPITTCSQ